MRKPRFFLCNSFLSQSAMLCNVKDSFASWCVKLTTQMPKVQTAESNQKFESLFAEGSLGDARYVPGEFCSRSLSRNVLSFPLHFSNAGQYQQFCLFPVLWERKKADILTFICISLIASEFGQLSMNLLGSCVSSFVFYLLTSFTPLPLHGFPFFNQLVNIVLYEK